MHKGYSVCASERVQASAGIEPGTGSKPGPANGYDMPSQYPHRLPALLTDPPPTPPTPIMIKQDIER